MSFLDYLSLLKNKPTIEVHSATIHSFPLARYGVPRRSNGISGNIDHSTPCCIIMVSLQPEGDFKHLSNKSESLSLHSSRRSVSCFLSNSATPITVSFALGRLFKLQSRSLLSYFVTLISRLLIASSSLAYRQTDRQLRQTDQLLTILFYCICAKVRLIIFRATLVALD